MLNNLMIVQSQDKIFKNTNSKFVKKVKSRVKIPKDLKMKDILSKRKYAIDLRKLNVCGNSEVFFPEAERLLHQITIGSKTPKKKIKNQLLLYRESIYRLKHSKNSHDYLFVYR